MNWTALHCTEIYIYDWRDFDGLFGSSLIVDSLHPPNSVKKTMDTCLKQYW